MSSDIHTWVVTVCACIDKILVSLLFLSWTMCFKTSFFLWLNLSFCVWTIREFMNTWLCTCHAVKRQYKKEQKNYCWPTRYCTSLFDVCMMIIYMFDCKIECLTLLHVMKALPYLFFKKLFFWTYPKFYWSGNLL